MCETVLWRAFRTPHEVDSFTKICDPHQMRVNLVQNFSTTLMSLGLQSFMTSSVNTGVTCLILTQPQLINSQRLKTIQ